MRFWRRARPTTRAADPDELVELAHLPLFDATLLAEKLMAHGLEAACIEASDVATRSLSHGRVFVRRHALADATRVWETA
jgi:hypothetical protein